MGKIASQLRDSAGLEPGFPRYLQGLLPLGTDRVTRYQCISKPLVYWLIDRDGANAIGRNKVVTIAVISLGPLPSLTYGLPYIGSLGIAGGRERQLTQAIAINLDVHRRILTLGQGSLDLP